MPDELISATGDPLPPNPGDPINPEGDLGGNPSPATDIPGKDEPDPGAGDEDEGFIEKDGVKYYKSFDKHPEWRDLQDTRKSVKGILADNGYNDMSELIADLQAGNSLAELLGTKDAGYVQELTDKATKWEKAEEYWAEQEALKLREGETKEETIERLEKSLRSERDARQEDRHGFEEMRATEEKLRAFNGDMSYMVEKSELGDTAKNILKLHLGVDNPMDDVDIGDRKSVRETAHTMIQQFADFIKAERQAAVDEYVKGRSSITPTPKPGSGNIPAVNDKRIDVKGKRPDEALDAANSVITEALTKMWKVAS